MAEAYCAADEASDDTGASAAGASEAGASLVVAAPAPAGASVVAPVASGTIAGFGGAGYRLAVEALVGLIRAED